MDCPQCRRECGQNDKFCSECGYKLCSARTPVTELSVPGKETGDSTDVSSADLSRVRQNSTDWTGPNCLASPSTSGAEPRRSSAVVHRVVPLDLQPRTKCTAIVSQEMEGGVQNNATPKTLNRNSNRQEGHEHPVCESHTHSDDNTHSQSIGHPDTGSSEDEGEVFEDAVEYLEDEAKEPEDSNDSVSVSEDEIISKGEDLMERPRHNCVLKACFFG
ncbi:uncharacterized protein LOC135247045 [Anguilla rostrata]|uniref:uncharacterized protein LOC135247045 n=1 Tax=Anguilla rostrata TaxID=7938 RepID=UPI0030CCF180